MTQQDLEAVMRPALEEVYQRNEWPEEAFKKPGQALPETYRQLEGDYQTLVGNIQAMLVMESREDEARTDYAELLRTRFANNAAAMNAAVERVVAALRCSSRRTSARPVDVLSSHVQGVPR